MKFADDTKIGRVANNEAGRAVSQRSELFGKIGLFKQNTFQQGQMHSYTPRNKE